jgi:hypothetical protein
MEEGFGNHICGWWSTAPRIFSTGMMKVWYDLGPVLSREKSFFVPVPPIVLHMQALIVRI